MTSDLAASKRQSKGLMFAVPVIPSGARSYELAGMRRKAASRRD